LKFNLAMNFAKTAPSDDSCNNILKREAVMYNLLIISIGECIGVISRYVVSGAVKNLSKSYNFPCGTTSVNLLGCSAINILIHRVGYKVLFYSYSGSCQMVCITGIGCLPGLETARCDKAKVVLHGIEFACA
jgi:hypothetical protein